jgi:hypothetical protein
MPFLIVTAGPTGSGKTQLIQETFFHLTGQRRLEYISFLVDDLVEQDKEYKQKVDAILDQFQCIAPYNQLNCDLTRPDPLMLNAFQEAYFEIRKKKGCNENKDNLTCDELNDRNIRLALKKEIHIVIETTGSYIPSWILDLPLPSVYKLVFSYSIVAFPILLERNFARVSESFATYIAHRKEARAPRLINLRSQVFGPIVNQIMKTLIQLRNNCLQDVVVDDACLAPTGALVLDNQSIYTLLLFDNTSKMTLIYDHRDPIFAQLSPLEFKELVKKAFYGLKKRIIGCFFHSPRT